MAEFEIDANLTNFERKLEGLSDKAAKEARQIAAEVDRALDSAGRGAPKAAQAAGALAHFSQVAKSLNANPVISNIEAMSSLFIPLGGNVSRVSMIFATAARPIATVGTLLGSLGAEAVALTGAAGVAAGALAALGYAMVSTGTNAVAATQETAKLVEQLQAAAKAGDPLAKGALAEFADQIARVTDYENLHAQATDDATRATLANARANAELAAGWERYTSDIKGWLTSWAPPLREWFNEATGWSYELQKLGIQELETAKAAKELADEQIRNVDAITALVDKVNQLDVAKIQAAYDASRIHFGHNMTAEELKAGLQNKNWWDGSSGAAKKQQSTNLDVVDVLSPEAINSAEIFSAQREAFNANEQNPLLESWSDYRARLPEILAEIQKAYDDEATKFQAAEAERARVFSEMIPTLVSSAASGVSDLVDAATNKTLAMYDEMIAAGDKLSSTDEARYERAIAARKRAAVVEVLVNAGVSYAGMVANLAPTMGPFAPAFAAGVVATQLIAPLSQILGESVPWSVGAGSGGGSGSTGTGLSITETVFGEREKEGPSWIERAFNNVLGRGGVDDDGNGKVTGGERNATARSSRGGHTQVVLDPRMGQLRVVATPPGKSWGGRL